MKKHMLFAALSACTIAALAAAVSAAEPDSVSVIADGYPYTGMVAVYNDTAYVSLREFPPRWTTPWYRGTRRRKPLMWKRTR